MTREEFKEIMKAAKAAEEAVIALNRICEKHGITGTVDSITQVKQCAWRKLNNKRTRPLVKTDGLTQLEILVLESSRETDYGDCLVEPQWSFSVCDKAGLDEKVYRGVVASLVKKGFVNIFDNENKGRFGDMIFSFTKEGRKLFDE